MLVLHFIPIRALLLFWGIIKFSKRIIRPHAVANNEVLDLLSRVPDDEELVSVVIDNLVKFPVFVFINKHITRFNKHLFNRSCTVSFRYNNNKALLVIHGRKNKHSYEID